MKSVLLLFVFSVSFIVQAQTGLDVFFPRFNDAFEELSKVNRKELAYDAYERWWDRIRPGDAKKAPFLVNFPLARGSDSRDNREADADEEDSAGAVTPPVAVGGSITALGNVVVDWTTPIGTGAFGPVYRGTLNGDIPVAVKEAIWVTSIPQLEHEIGFAKGVVHPNAGRVYGLLPADAKHGAAIVVERLGSSLEDVILGNTLSDEMRLKITRDIVAGMAAVHANRVAHLDLKPQNILFTEDGSGVKVVDFGLSASRGRLNENGSNPKTRDPPQYAAPEACKDNTSDGYYFAIVLYELWSGRRAWLGTEPMQVFKAIAVGKRPSSSPNALVELGIPKPIASIIFSSWDQDPYLRPSFADLLTVLQDPQILKKEFLEL